MNLCPTRRLPTRPGVSLALPDQSRLSVVKSGQFVTSQAAQLPNGFWLTDLSYEEAQTINDRRKINRVIHSDGWLGARWRDILHDCGLSACPSVSEMIHLATMSERIIRLSVCAVTKSDHWIHSGQQLHHRRSFGRPSLALALADYWRPLLVPSTPKHSCLAENGMSLLLYGCRSRGVRHFEDNVIVKVMRPKFSYLQQLAEQDYPSGREWQEIECPHKGEPLSDETEATLVRLKKPVIVQGSFQSHKLMPPAWVHSWCQGLDPTWGRNWFTLPEVTLMRKVGHFFVTHIYAGQGFVRPHKNTVLNQLIQGVIAACGSERSARCAFSAGLAIENNLRALCIQRPTLRPLAAMQAIWIAVNDRLESVNAIEAAEAEGAKFLAAQGGSLTFAVENKREVISRVVSVLWQTGHHLPVGLARHLKKQDIDLKAQSNEFGGQEGDAMMAVASQLGLCGLVRRMDEIAGNGKSRQGKKLDQLEAALARFPS